MLFLDFVLDSSGEIIEEVEKVDEVDEVGIIGVRPKLRMRDGMIVSKRAVLNVTTQCLEQLEISFYVMEFIHCRRSSSEGAPAPKEVG